MWTPDQPAWYEASRVMRLIEEITPEQWERRILTAMSKEYNYSFTLMELASAIDWMGPCGCCGDGTILHSEIKTVLSFHGIRVVV